MSRKRNDSRKVLESNSKTKHVRGATGKIGNACHKTIAACRTAFLFLTVMYFMSGTLAMGIVYHQHKGHLFSWLAGDESMARKQAAIEQLKATEQAELEADCQASYNMSCTQYTLAIGEATRSSKHDPKQVAMLEKAKNRARAAM